MLSVSLFFICLFTCLFWFSFFYRYLSRFCDIFLSYLDYTQCMRCVHVICNRYFLHCSLQQSLSFSNHSLIKIVLRFLLFMLFLVFLFVCSFVCFFFVILYPAYFSSKDKAYCVEDVYRNTRRKQENDDK